MIYDCFTFFNELELLEIRLCELAPVVDHFVIVEATRTHSNQPKPLYFDENRERFHEFLPKIIHIVVDDFPDNPENRWVLENYQRNAIMRGLKNCQPYDTIIISDIDEIISHHAILSGKDKPGIKIFNQKLYYYFINCLCTTQTWSWAKMIFYRDLRSPQWLRDYPKLTSSHPGWISKKLAKYKHRLYRRLGLVTYLNDGGWHFSFLGGIDKVQTKVHSFAHDDLDKEEYLREDRLKHIIESGSDLFGRESYKFEFVPLDLTYPRCLIDNACQYKDLIYSTQNQHCNAS